jgi:CRP/FNR family transcriptional regulator, cyclic AMP receptor protein
VYGSKVQRRHPAAARVRRIDPVGEATTGAEPPSDSSALGAVLAMIPHSKTRASEFGRAILAEAGEAKSIAIYRKGQAIFAQADPADAIYYVQKGKVKLTVVSRNGKEVVVGLLGAGDFLGEGCRAGQEARMFTATVMCECSVVRLEKAGVKRMLRDEPAFSEVFLKHLLSRNIRIEEDLVDQLFNSSEKRLAWVLLKLANFGKDATPDTVIPNKPGNFGAIVGPTRSRISFFMTKFRKLGFIEYNGQLKIHSSLLNVILRD